ncbi:uncharacterized protein METZ01_LOCUS187865, partial [marine metagenome]
TAERKNYQVLHILLDGTGLLT